MSNRSAVVLGLAVAVTFRLVAFRALFAAAARLFLAAAFLAPASGGVFLRGLGWLGGSFRS